MSRRHFQRRGTKAGDALEAPLQVRTLQRHPEHTSSWNAYLGKKERKSPKMVTESSVYSRPRAAAWSQLPREDSWHRGSGATERWIWGVRKQPKSARGEGAGNPDSLGAFWAPPAAALGYEATPALRVMLICKTAKATCISPCLLSNLATFQMCRKKRFRWKLKYQWIKYWSWNTK